MRYYILNEILDFIFIHKIINTGVTAAVCEHIFIFIFEEGNLLLIIIY